MGGNIIKEQNNLSDHLQSSVCVTILFDVLKNLTVYSHARYVITGKHYLWEGNERARKRVYKDSTHEECVKVLN